MEVISNVVPMVRQTLKKLSNESGPPPRESPELCTVCHDSGMEIVPGKGAKTCDCAKKAIVAAKLNSIPARFRNMRLETMKARPDLHEKQKSAIDVLRKNPQGSYILAGDFGTGKSALMWALYANAVERNVSRVVACTLTELLTEYKTVFTNPDKLPRLSAFELRRGIEHSVFLDDIDKARPTEYAAEQFFELCDALYAHQHQLVVTTNLRVGKLQDHFGRADERYGGAIVRRLVDGAEIIDLF